MDDGKDDCVLFGDKARSRSLRAVDYRYKSWGTYGFYWNVNRVPHVQFSLKEKKKRTACAVFFLRKKKACRACSFLQNKKSMPHVLFSLKEKSVRHVLSLLKGKKARAIDSFAFLISLVGR